MNHAPVPAAIPARRPAGPVLAAAGLVVLAGAAFASLALGARTVAPADVLDALLAFDGSAAHVAVAEVRLPRTVVAAAVGATLAVAGLLTQAITRNPLADPSILGVSWGSALAAVGGQVVFGVDDAAGLVALALAGGAGAALVVMLLGLLDRGPRADERLVVAGAAVSALLAAIVQGLLVVDRESLEVARRWLAGSLTGAGWDGLVAAAPVLAVGAVLALVLARPLTTLGLGDDVAAGLGVRAGRVKAAAAVAVVALAGGSVALAGPIVLVGLAVPHAARRLVGPGVGPGLAACAILGATFVVLGDTVARMLIAPEELPVGVVTAVIGGPVLVQLARTADRRG